MAKPRLFVKFAFSLVLLAFAITELSPKMAFAAIYEDANKLDRMHFSKKAKLNKVGGGDPFEAGPSFSYEVLEYGHVSHKLRIFDEDGKQVEGVYEITSDIFQDLLRHQISVAIEKVPEGSKNKKAGCCDLDGKKEDSKAKVVKAKPAPEKLNLPDEGPIPKPKPKPEGEEEEPAEELAASPSTEICTLYKKFSKAGVPRDALKQALTYYTQNKSRFANQNYLSIADYSAKSTKKRFYLLNLKSGTVTQEKVSHGKGADGAGDPNHDGVLDRCRKPKAANDNLNMTRVGFFKIDDYYWSDSHGPVKKKIKNKKGKWVWITKPRKWPDLVPGRNGLRMSGLSPTNHEANADGVVMHEAFYNSEGNGKMGRSFGCPAFAPGKGAPLMEKMRNGSLFYSYAPVCASDMNTVLKQVPGWQGFCNDRRPSLEEPREDSGTVKLPDEAPIPKPRPRPPVKKNKNKK